MSCIFCVTVAHHSLYRSNWFTIIIRAPTMLLLHQAIASTVASGVLPFLDSVLTCYIAYLLQHIASHIMHPILPTWCTLVLTNTITLLWGTQRCIELHINQRRLCWCGFLTRPAYFPCVI